MFKGRKHSEETRRKISVALKRWNIENPDSSPMLGKYHSVETRRKMSEIAKKRPPFTEEHRRKMGEARKGKPFSEEHKRNMSKAAKNRPPRSIEHRHRLSKAMTGKKHSEQAIEKMRKLHTGENNAMYGRRHSDETKRKISEKAKGRPGLPGKMNPMWRGGVSFEPYSPEFNDALKRQIRERDNHTCQYCGEPGKYIHHIDHDKKNSTPSNLITLCLPHNTKAEFNPILWECIFYTILSYRGVGVSW